MARRGISPLISLIVAVVTPATLALSLYTLTGDVSFRPLAITIERIARGETRDGIPVIARLRLPGAADDGAVRLAGRVHASFDAQGIAAVVVIEEGAARDAPYIRYEVGGTAVGLYPPHRAAQGVAAATHAYRMAREAR